MKQKILILSTIFAYFISGCNSHVQPTFSATIIPYPSVSARPTDTPIFRIQVSTEITSTSTPSPTKPTYTSTPISLPTLTQLPVFSTADAIDVLGQFVKNNGGCKLPCVFGLTPGISDILSSDSLLRYFQEHIYSIENRRSGVDISTIGNADNGGVFMTFYKEQIGVSFVFDFEGIEKNIPYITMGAEGKKFYQDSSGFTEASIVFGDPYFIDLTQIFSLSQIINNYGTPEQILVLPFPDIPYHPSPPALYPFIFVLFYPNQGFLIEYVTKRQETNGQYIGCPTQSYKIELSAWNSSDQLTIDQAIKGFSSTDGITIGNIEQFMPLQNQTNLSIDQFVELYKNQKAQGCVYTQKEIWPTSEP
jgi:hypothetical protein